MVIFFKTTRWFASVALLATPLASAQEHPLAATVAAAADDASTPPIGYNAGTGAYVPTAGGVGGWSPIYNTGIRIGATPTSNYLGFHIPDTLSGFVQQGDIGLVLLTAVPWTTVPVQGYSQPLSISFAIYCPGIKAWSTVCAGESAPCSPDVDFRFYALYGSIAGRVTHADGTPVAAGITVAAYPAATPTTLQRFTVTDGQGRYTFTETDAAVLLNRNRDLSPDHPAIPGYVALAPGNNWGLRLDCDPATAGTWPASRDYTVVAGFDDQGNPLPASAPNAATVTVRSSMAYVQNLRADGLCRLPALSPITDPLAQQFEAQNGNVVDVADLTPTMQAALNCFQGAVASAGGTITVVSAFRPSAYQDHLREVWMLWDRSLQLDATERADCGSLLAQLQVEMNRHDLVFLPAGNSAHTQGEAFDANVNVQGGSAVVDALATGCGLRRPVPVGDPNHFTR